MNINFTLFVEMVIFIGFVSLTMRYIWPHLALVIQERQKEIIQGIQDAKAAKAQKLKAEEEALAIIDEAKGNAASLIKKAHSQSDDIIKQAKEQTKIDHKNALKKQQLELAQAREAEKTNIMASVVATAADLAEKLILQKLSTQQHSALVKHLTAEPRSHD